MALPLPTSETERVVKLIQDAFRGVVLGDGVGLHQGDGLDDYADASTLAALRAEDEKEDWTRIPISELRRYFGSLCFMDSEGMRFHLPAFLLAEIFGELEYQVAFHLTYRDDDGYQKVYEIFTPEQRHAVREFLLLCLASGSHEFERPAIETALNDYWRPVK